MKRDYINQDHNDDTAFFIGKEVENTSTKGMKTLFVVGIQDINEVISYAKKHRCRAIYFGANHSFSPSLDDEWKDLQVWEDMILFALNDPASFRCTLDFDLKYMDSILQTSLVEDNCFIPMVSVKMPYIDQLGYNATIKIDDKDFNATNPGVWCHNIQRITHPTVFTHWQDYNDDEVI